MEESGRVEGTSIVACEVLVLSLPVHHVLTHEGAVAVQVDIPEEVCVGGVQGAHSVDEQHNERQCDRVVQDIPTQASQQ